jgi:hypothetical protein
MPGKCNSSRNIVLRTNGKKWPCVRGLRGWLNPQAGITGLDARQQALANGMDDDGFQAVMKQVDGDYLANVRQTIGDSAFQQLYGSQNDPVAASTAQQVASSLMFSETPLSAAQVVQLAQVLTQSEAASNSSNASMGGAALPADALARLSSSLPSGSTQAIITDGVIAAAQGFLSPSQIAPLKAIQAMQQAEIQLTPTSANSSMP